MDLGMARKRMGGEGDGRQDSGGGSLLLKGLHLLSFVALIRFQWGPTFKEHSLKRTYPTSHLLLAAVRMFPKGTQNLQSHDVDTLIDTLSDCSKTALGIQRLRNNTHSTVMPPTQEGRRQSPLCFLPLSHTTVHRHIVSFQRRYRV